GRACEVTLPEEDAQPQPPSIDSRRRRPWRTGIALGLLSSAVLLALALTLLRPPITHQNGSDSGKEVAEQQEQAVARVDHRVDPLEEHGGAARQEHRDEVR